MPGSNSQSTNTARFVLALVCVFVGAHVLLSFVGLIPSEVSAFNNQVAQAVQSLHTIKYEREASRIDTKGTKEITKNTALPQAPDDMRKQTGEKPQRIIIDKIGINTRIANPATTSLSVLNDALNESPVRYPNSGRINGKRPMFLFGHSSRLPVVQNEAYKSFNGLNELTVGDTITVQGTSTSETYMVQSVDVVKKDEGFISFAPNQKVDLTISTCSTFGAKQNRTIVRAQKM